MVTKNNNSNNKELEVNDAAQLAEMEAAWEAADNSKRKKKGKTKLNNIEQEPAEIVNDDLENLAVSSSLTSSKKKGKKNKSNNIDNILAQNNEENMMNELAETAEKMDNLNSIQNSLNKSKKKKNKGKNINNVLAQNFEEEMLNEKPAENQNETNTVPSSSKSKKRNKNSNNNAENENKIESQLKTPETTQNQSNESQAQQAKEVISAVPSKKAPPKSKAAQKMLERLAKENERKEKLRLEEEERQRKLKELEEETKRKEEEAKKRKEEQKLKEKAHKKEQKQIDAENKLKERQNRLMQGKTVIATAATTKKQEKIEYDNTEIYSNDQIAQISGLNIDKNFRSPIICILGHVDTGKTKILDQLRCTKVQDHEAGGITQQIGATNVSAINIQDSIKNTALGKRKLLKLPGILLIDTPGHESFHNLRVRGTSLCDICILIVDITHGLEPQTIESLKILRDSKTKYIVALNKIDKIHGWEAHTDLDVQQSISKQNIATKSDFDDRFSEIFSEFAAQNVNIALFYDQKSLSIGTDIVPCVPTSAHSGEGIPDLMSLVCLVCQSALKKQLVFKSDVIEGHLMEAKHIQGYGITLDVILINGELKEGDTIVVIDNFEPVVTKIKFILVPPTMAEMRVKVALKNVPAIKGTRGIKITLQSSEISSNIMVGLPLVAATNPSDEKIQEMIAKLNIQDQLSRLSGFSDIGVHVQSSTMGSLEAILKDLKTKKIPYSSCSIGDVHKKDIWKASTMLEKSPLHSVILAFNVKIEKEAQEIAKQQGIKIFSHEIVYHLYDQYQKYETEAKEKLRKDNYDNAIFPCVLKILPECVFNMKDPLVCGVLVEEGEIRTSTRIRVFTEKDNFVLGKIASIEKDKKTVESATKGEEVAIKVVHVGDGSQKLYGRQYDANDSLISDLTRESIDILKNYFREELMKKKLWKLVASLKDKLGVI